MDRGVGRANKAQRGKFLAQGHTAATRQSQDLTSGCLTPKFTVLTSALL